MEIEVGSKNQLTSKRAIIYLRVSTEEQVDNYSLETQEDICQKEAVRRGYEVTTIFREEGKSAKNIVGRPVLINLLEFCRKNKNQVQAVFVYRLDRISRQTSDYLAIRKKLAENGVTILSATEPTGNSPTEKLVETMLAAFGQLDNDVRSERTKNGMRARFLSGLPNCKPPVGYMLKSGYVINDPETFDLMKKAWELMSTGTKSLSEMAIIMNDWGLRVKTKSKTFKLRSQTLSRFFRCKFYMGILTSEHYPEEVVGKHTAMISQQMFYKVQAIIDGRNPNKLSLTHRVRENPKFPLRRFAKCGLCGAAFTGYWCKGNGGKYAYYRCSKFCTGKSVKVEVMDEELIKLLKDITPTEEGLELFISFIQRHYYKRLSRLQKVRNDSDSEIVRLQDLRQQLVEKNLSGVFSDDIFKEQNKRIEDQIFKAQIAKHDETFEKYDVNKITDFMKTLLADLGETYKQSDLGQKKMLIGSIYPSGIVWSYPGYSNHEVGAIYQAIQDTSSGSIPLGDPEGIRTPDSQDENLMS